jgi:hypothetical protein
MFVRYKLEESSNITKNRGGNSLGKSKIRMEK